MFVTTVIPTIGRASLDRSVGSVPAQEESADFEVVVVNDSGRALPPARWHASARVRIISTCQRERSVARNAGAALARGHYLHFLDDDDWLLPGAFRTLAHLADAWEARWLYGGSQLVDRRGNDIIELHHDMTGNIALQVMAGEWIPLQSSLLEAELFFDLGGFDPSMSGAEDTDLTRRVAVETDAAGTREFVACIGMGTEGSTTDATIRPQLVRKGREGVLDEAGVFGRLRAGATSPYWHGRLARIYLTSTLWNLSHRRVNTALSRSMYAVAALLLAGLGLVMPDFWLALTKAYRNETFERGFKQAGLAHVSDARSPKR